MLNKGFTYTRVNGVHVVQTAAGTVKSTISRSAAMDAARHLIMTTNRRKEQERKLARFARWW